MTGAGIGVKFALDGHRLHLGALSYCLRSLATRRFSLILSVCPLFLADCGNGDSNGPYAIFVDTGNDRLYVQNSVEAESGASSTPDRTIVNLTGTKGIFGVATSSR